VSYDFNAQDYPPESRQDTWSAWDRTSEYPPANPYVPPAPAPQTHRQEPVQQHRHEWQAAPATGTGWNQPPQAEDEELWPSRRREVASAIRSMNGNRGSKAYLSLGTKQPLSPHGVSLFYSYEDPRRPGGLRIYTAARWAVATPLTSDLPLFLSELADTASRFAAAARHTSRRWDPRGPDKPLVNKGDTDIPKAATYIGLGVETLDTAKGNWMDRVALDRDTDPMRRSIVTQFPGEAVVLLTDDSVLRVLRDPQLPLGYDGVWCSKPLHADRKLLITRDVVQRLGPRLLGAWPEIENLSILLKRHCEAP
jgi:hypothetical protein